MDTLQCSLPSITEGDISEAEADDSDLRTNTTPASVLSARPKPRPLGLHLLLKELPSVQRLADYKMR